MIEGAVLTHVGRVRAVNEDATAQLMLGAVDPSGVGQALCVLDGVGGRQGGSYASRWALANLAEALALPDWSLSGHDALWQTHVEDRLVALVAAIDAALVARGRESDELRGMATTLVAVLFFGDWYCALHVGDSRAYLLRDGRIQQLTIDHTWAEEQLRTGASSLETIRTSPYRDQLVQVLGGGRPLNPSISFGRVAVGDRFLVCSDGLTKHVAPVDIGTVLRDGSSASSIAATLVDRANAGGGADNISVAVGIVRTFSPTRMVEPESATLRLDAHSVRGAYAGVNVPQRPRRRAGVVVIIAVASIIASVAAGAAVWWYLPAWRARQDAPPARVIRPPPTRPSPASARMPRAARPTPSSVPPVRLLSQPPTSVPPRENP